MTYPTFETVNATTDLTNLLIYTNDVTYGKAMPAFLFMFFFVVMMAGYYAQLRFGRNARLDFSFTVAGFASFGLAVIMSMKDGLLDPMYLFITLGVAMMGVAWIYFASE